MVLCLDDRFNAFLTAHNSLTSVGGVDEHLSIGRFVQTFIFERTLNLTNISDIRFTELEMMFIAGLSEAITFTKQQ